MTFDEWKKAGSPPPMSFDQWKASQAKPAGPDYAGDAAKFGKGKLMADQPSAIGDFASGLGHGVMAPIRGARQLFNYATNDQKTLDRLQREEEEASKKLGGWGQAGNVIGQVGTAFIPVAGQAGKLVQGTAAGAKALSGAQKLGTVGKAAATGAGVAALDPTMSKEGKSQDYLTEKAKDVALGAGLGGGAAKVAQALSPASAAVQKASKDLGGMATPGQLLSAAAGNEGKLRNATEWERRAGMVLPGSGILKSRDAAHEAGVMGLMAREAERAGVDISKGKNFQDAFKLAQEGKAAGYADTVKDLSFGKSNKDFSNAVSQSMMNHTQNLTGPIRQDVQSALRTAGVMAPHNVAGKTQLGQYTGQNVQDVLSTLNKEISSRFGQNATRQDNAAGEALSKVRDDLMKLAEKNSNPDSFKRYQDLNRLHQMVGPETQTKRGVFGRAGSYVNAQERGSPTLREVTQAATAGKQTKARNELAKESSELERVAGKHSTTGQGELSKIFRIGAGVASGAASPFTLGAQFLPQAVYNPYVLKKLNKLAQEGNPEAQRMLVMAGKAGAATNLE